MVYNFTEEHSAEVIIEGKNYINIKKIEKKMFGKLYLELFKDNTYNIRIRNLNKNESLSYITFTITGKVFDIDIERNIIEFDKIESINETSPLIFKMSSNKKSHFKKFVMENDNISELNSIQVNSNSILNNFYYFKKFYDYSIRINFIKKENVNKNAYVANPFKLIELPMDNFEYINKSRNISFNETNIDKFLLFDLGSFTKVTINLYNNTSIIKKAIIDFFQYKFFPEDIHKIKFEKVENNSLEIKKDENVIYGIFSINSFQNSTKMEFIFVNDTSPDNINNGGKGLSTLSIVLISVSGAIFIAVLIIVIIIIKKKTSKNKEIKIKPELIELYKGDVDQD